LADFPSYVETQEQVSRDYGDAALWARKAILNVARMGKFSSDRTIAEYAREIWGLLPELPGASKEGTKVEGPREVADDVVLKSAAGSRTRS
jgi:hypothetical protein